MRACLQSFPEASTALIQGASRGIGLGLVEALLECPRFERVIATCRDPGAAVELQARACARLQIEQLDVTQPDAIDALAARLSGQGVRLNLVINAAGLLHGAGVAPEKKLEDLDLTALQRVFAVNAYGPALLLKALRPLLAREGKSVFAAISAWVGSIGDNRLGGWYAYRASKSALNQLMKTASIELKRRNRKLVVACLHPGTTDTALSQPFQANVPEHKLFPVSRTSAYLLEVIDGLNEDDSGGFFAWDGAPIEW
ncbi:MAG: cell-cell signaling protein [Gammaproteobacteria bacterium HGW-Gammaproteobacteria-8]|nr:MAG: cell-cell signaling protein [Gammaproteobacteria bacterium HGW-Gammaproteobacteria-8]